MSESWLVTGANRGIGLELVRQCAATGYSVIATARNPDSATDLSTLASDYAGLVTIAPLDVTDAESVAALAKQFENVPIDILINNAGTYGGNWKTDGHRQELRTMDYELWDEIHRVNVAGPLRMVNALLPNLKAGRRKLIVNMSSDLGSITNNTMGGSHAYRSSKTALNMLTCGLAIDLADDGMTVISMAPGWTKTEIGGEKAHWETADSVRNQLKVIAELSTNDTGQFINLLGERVSW